MGVPIQVYRTPELARQAGRCVLKQFFLSLLPTSVPSLPSHKGSVRENETAGPILDGFPPSQEEGNESPSNKK